LKHAYDGSPPFEVRDRLEALRRQPVETFYECDVLERDLHRPPTRYQPSAGESKLSAHEIVRAEHR